MVERYDPSNPRANQQSFVVDPPNFEFRATIALMFGLMFCLPIAGGIVAIAMGRSVLQATVPKTILARNVAWIAIGLGAANCIIWSVRLIQLAIGETPMEMPATRPTPA
ncbi:MAG TPA: hypothetical protein VGN72_07065 [Tepidisphaeraceae bacterium]|nr:hypothetical protein [Tepidisphaeraceae bacterium]